MEGIIVGVDESSYAYAALQWAAGYGAVHGLPVTAVLAWDYLSQPHVDPDAEFDVAYGAESAAKVLDELVNRALGSDNDIVRIVVCDRPGRALVEAAGDAHLLVVGARGMTGFRGLLLGSVSRHALHAARATVAVVHDNAVRAGHPIVVGLDGSESSTRALRWAIEHARLTGDELVAVHAWDYPAAPLGLIGPPDHSELARQAKELLQRETADAGLRIGKERLSLCAREGAASSILLDAGATASMLVVGSRGRGGLSSTMLGSVSEHVSQHASCPVVVVH